ncbi:hypothetical protein MYCTH_2295331 [Thermothelomyces thermophilus ATCC 42464]|uniref:Uncharacterized protein n=1 Tax=Thermothelomyces thermophilus (strain ATCC 42464 / BCRC 31852 / DSM 1799) TaxID=573729 RepID=G2Q4H9_THET4|nr:uncharacterized protein MYCTH_2295331 [Thermothelomyces thermophilus ATCC 42464]AEO53672.1 hypothetical protein MYCTH_2295331 [Thermothelomyces thermophilus ATCC 42464]
MASSPEMTILEPCAGSSKWQLSKKPFSLEAVEPAALPKQCYIFLDVRDYPPADGRRQKLLAHFGVPEFVANRTCFEVNGYFGNKATYTQEHTSTNYITSYSAIPTPCHAGHGQELTGAATWFRCLVKMVKKVEEDAHDNDQEYVTSSKGYKWFEMSFFTRWDHPNSSRILCVDCPPDFPDELLKLLRKRTEPLDFRDPYAMHTNLVDQLIVYADIAVWRVRDPVRLLEKYRMRTGAIFGPIHEMSRHAIHTSEVLEATIETLTEMQECRTAIQGKLLEDLGETYIEQANGYAQFQISLVKSLKLRSESNHRRLENEINLAFNNIARQDNSVMKSIALLTMVFLPATFISAIFSTTFFSFGEENKTWEVSDKLWIYWATTIPATIVTVVLWQVWLVYGDVIAKFSQTQYEQALARWKSLRERRVQAQRASDKVETA